MSENIPQTSASERVAEARRAVATAKDFAISSLPQWAHDLIAATEALITPPSVGESEEAIAERVLPDDSSPDWSAPLFTEVRALIMEGIRAGIQSAHETWEPADRPSQEQMLRWLGLRYGDAGRPTHIHIPFQTIEKEEI